MTSDERTFLLQLAGYSSHSTQATQTADMTEQQVARRALECEAKRLKISAEAELKRAEQAQTAERNVAG